MEGECASLQETKLPSPLPATFPTFVSARIQSILGKSLLVVLSLISQVSSTFSTSILHRLGFKEENIFTFPVLSFFTTTLS